MAVLRYGEALADFGSPIDQIDIPSLDPVTATEDLASLADKNGAVVNITGTLLAYSAEGIVGGFVTGVEMFAPGGGSLFSITGINTEAGSFVASFLATGDVDIAVLAGNDRIFGSSNSDLLAGGAGDDRIFGGGGRDLLGGMDGRDKMTGGLGADVFVFAPNQGRDTVMDFTDTGGRNDDFIAVRPAMYDRMVMTQEGNDVLLSFGKAGSLLILNQTMAEMGLDDFTSGLPI
jgi:serralysin